MTKLLPLLCLFFLIFPFSLSAREGSDGQLVVYFNPATHKVSVDGVLLQQHYRKSPLSLDPSKKHKVLVRSLSDEKITRTYEVSVKSGEVLALYVDLSGAKPLPERKEIPEAPAEDTSNQKGRITVNCPPHMHIYIDGKRIQTSCPLVEYEIENGMHSVRIYDEKEKKFDPNTKNIFVLPNQTSIASF